MKTLRIMIEEGEKVGSMLNEITKEAEKVFDRHWELMEKYENPGVGAAYLISIFGASMVGLLAFGLHKKFSDEENMRLTKKFSKQLSDLIENNLKGYKNTQEKNNEIFK